MRLALPWRARPGAGFVVLTLTVLAAIAFLAWGLRTPGLESFWKLQLELELGERGQLNAREFALLQDELWTHPAIADDVVADSAEGILSAADANRVDSNYAYLVRRSSDALRTLRARPDPRSARPEKLAIHARTSAGELAEHVMPDGSFEWTPPRNARFPLLIELTVESKRRVPLTIEWVEARR